MHIKIFLILLCLLLMVFTGCTLHFKASELELEAQQSRTFKLDGLDVFGCPVVSHLQPHSHYYDAMLQKQYARQY